MAKDEVLAALKALNGEATKNEIFDYLQEHGNDMMNTVLWQALMRLQDEGTVRYYKRTKIFKLTGRQVAKNVVILLNNGRIRRLAA